jgi:hypothetical protein
MATSREKMLLIQHTLDELRDQYNSERHHSTYFHVSMDLTTEQENYLFETLLKSVAYAEYETADIDVDVYTAALQATGSKEHAEAMRAALVRLRYCQKVVSNFIRDWYNAGAKIGA